MRSPLPHSERQARSVSSLLELLPKHIDRLLEPFVGAGSVTLAAAQQNKASSFAVGDDNALLVAIWQLMIERPSVLSEGYEAALSNGPPRSGPVRLLFDLLEPHEVATDELSEGVNAVHRLLRGRAVSFAGDYSLLVRAAQPEDLVYLDPPALSVGGSSTLDVARLQQVVDDAVQRGVRVLARTEVNLGLPHRQLDGATVWWSYETGE